MLKRSSDNRLNGAQVIVDYLIREKVPYAFGLCGHGNIQFIDALHERQSDIKTISVHHESVCGFMADAYYRVKGQPVATFTSCGPGSANLPISLGNAFLDSVPFLAVTGNVPTSQFNRGAFLRALKQAGFFTRTCYVPGAGHYWLSDPIDEPGSYCAVFAPRLIRFLAEKL